MTYPTIKADANGIAQASRMIRAGEVIAVPTETVYGIVADATNKEAIRLLYKIKRRSDSKPCQVLVRNMRAAQQLAYFDRYAEKLAQSFWPGPLTMILPCKEDASIAGGVQASDKTIGLRVPDHQVMQAILLHLDIPLAASSANGAGDMSPLTALEARAALGDAVGMVLDGGRSIIGQASTVLDISGKSPRILREGVIARRQIEEVLKISLQ